MRTVGVRYNGLILVVGFRVDPEPAESFVGGNISTPYERIDIIDIKAFGESRGIYEISEGLAEKIAAEPAFRLIVLHAIASYNGQDFDPEEFKSRRLN